MSLAVDTEISVKEGFPIELGGNLWAWLNLPRDPNFDDFGPRDKEEFMVQLRRRVRREKTWLINCGGSAVGFIGFVPQNPVTGQFHGMVIRPSFRHKGCGREAARVVVDQLFSEGFRKLTVMTFADNHHIWSVFRSLGFEEEGLIQGATQRGGKPLDMRMLGLSNWGS
jgi:RimJ/RimL family protein N-acetyltransferase